MIFVLALAVLLSSAVAVCCGLLLLSPARSRSARKLE